MRFTIDLSKIKKVILIVFITILATYITIRSIILIIDYNERNKPKVEEIKKSYT
jgi:hypothetical protein